MAPNKDYGLDHFSEDCPTRMWSHISDSAWMMEMGNRMTFSKGADFGKGRRGAAGII